MKGATIFLLVISATVGVIVALPIEPDVSSEVENVHILVPTGPVVVEAATPDKRTLVRERRSPKPDDSRGSVGATIEEESRQGTKIKVDADRVLWQSEDGKSKLGVTGEWSKVIDGPGRGKPDVKGLLTFTHDF